jgi:membrane associated rhomboid family serine protease
LFIPLHDDNPLKHIRFQYVTVAIIAACVVVFLYQAGLAPTADRAFVFSFGAIPAVVFGSATLPPDFARIPAPLTLITSMFLHGGLMHLLGNMLFLWVLGDNVEDALGHRRYVVFYLVCGVLAALAHAAMEPGSTIPMVGASGAISGVMGAYLVLHPKARIKVLVSYFIVWLPAFVVLGVWIVFQVISAGAAAGGAGGGVAWWAHIGGFAAGAILIVPMRMKDIALFDRDLGRGEFKLKIEPRRRDPRRPWR